MIIKCPSCGRRFDLQRKAPTTFRCPKCRFTTPFINILEAEKNTDVSHSTALTTDGGSNAASATTMDQHTRVVSELQNNDKTHVVERLQPRKPGPQLQVTFRNQMRKSISLTPGRFTLGRDSSDSSATIKLAPDINMSRVHASLYTVKSPTGALQFAISPANANNPLYVNNKPVANGAAVLLRHGDVIMMGETTIRFILQ